MGLSISTLWSRLIGSNKEYKVLMLGLDAAGKTTILYKLRLGEVVTTIPTIGFNVEKVDYRNINFTVWDVGGQDKIRRLWNYYYDQTDALIFVIDSNDSDRLQIAKNELYRLLNQDELRNVSVLVFANKQDLPNAMKPCAIMQDLSLDHLKNQWYIQACCATSGDGLFQGLDWLADNLQNKTKQ